MSPLLLLLFLLLPAEATVRCHDCVGEDCMGSFCEGDYCMLSYYAPRWGTQEWGKRVMVKGCANGNMLMKNIRDHCEVADGDDDDLFTCFCNKRDNCNAGKIVNKLPRERVELLTCKCDGRHCDGYKTCTGELCTYVVNLATEEVERGCVNASIPLVERRSAGSCMIPPITGAMHHSVAQTPKDLLSTESCVCGTNNCNKVKPSPPESSEHKECTASVSMEYMGNKMESKIVNCTGEYCFVASITSKMGALKEYTTKGCATFVENAQLAEEFTSTGCAYFKSEKLTVQACYKARPEDARRALKNRQQKPRLWRKGERGKMEVDIEDDEEEEEEEEDDLRKKNKKKGKERQEDKDEEEEEIAEQKEEEEEKKEEKVKEEAKEEEEKKEEEEEEATTVKYVYVLPTKAEIPDESNATMIAVFILIILCICVAGITWKFQLHRKLMRANYDTVAGGT